jgi:hypothetical protein
MVLKRKNKLIKWGLIGSGTVFLGLGIIGIFLPLLPTTPFILLAASCYARSSKRLYDWLLNNRWFGNYVRNYREGKGIPRRVKILSVSFLWIVIGYSVLFVVNTFSIRIVLFLIAVGVTIHILSIKTLKP